jgi:hypothetical protein
MNLREQRRYGQQSSDDGKANGADGGHESLLE